MTFEPAPNSPARKPINPILKLALELGPLGVFFFANARGARLAESFPALATFGGPIFVATAAFIIATVLALIVSYALTRRLPLMPFVTAIVVVVFGGLALWFKNDTFVTIKPTIIYLLFGTVLLGGLLFGKSFLGYVFDAMFRLTDEGWRKLTLRWGIFFLFLAALNQAVWLILDQKMEHQAALDTWVSFKVFGFLPLTLVFAVAQLPLINRTTIPEKGAEAP